LKKLVTLPKYDIKIAPQDWVYKGAISTTGIDTEHIRNIHGEIRNKGVCIVSMPPLATNFFVFDLELDVGSARIYSDDMELTEFKKARHRMEMSVHGIHLRGGEEKFVGTVEIPTDEAANNMGIDNFSLLQRQGFYVSYKEFPYEEAFRRGLQRHLNESDELKKEAELMGIEITDIHVNKVTLGDSAINTEIAPESAEETIAENKKISKPSARSSEIDLTETDKKRRYWENKKWIAISTLVIVMLGAIADAQQGFDVLLKLTSKLWNFVSPYLSNISVSSLIAWASEFLTNPLFML